MLFLKLRPAPSEYVRPQRKLVIVGNSLTAYRIAEHFHTLGTHVSLICAANTLEALVPDSPVPIVTCDPFSPQEVALRGGNDADLIVLTLRNERKTVEFARVMKHYLGISSLIATVRENQTAHTLRDLGVKALSTRDAMHLALEQYVTSPALFNALTLDETTRLFETKINSGPMVGSRLSEFQKDLPHGASVLLVTRNEEALTADPNMVLLEGDMLTLLGDVHLTEEFDLCRDERLCSINI
jgi:Trk K+ transport system NAD-binding subunit